MTPLVSLAWLASHLHDPAVVACDATLPPPGVLPPPDVRARYLASHLPGALYFDTEALSDSHTSLPHMLPRPEVFAESMSNLGISREMTIVAYEQQGVFSAPRCWWMLRTFGAANVFILDGDLRAWTDAGYPTEAGHVHRERSSFQAVLDRRAVRDYAEVKQVLANHGQVLDARSAARFAGSAPEPRPGISSGHMPGSISIPFTDLVRDGRLRSAEHLAACFAARSVNLSQPITTSCGSGVTAAVLALGLELCGAKHVSLYDGSWAEYAQQPDAVIAKTP